MNETCPTLPQTGSAAEAVVPGPGVRTIGVTAPFRWLALGWADFRGTRFRGSFYGVAFAAMGGAILLAHLTEWQLALTLSVAFLLLGPFVCAGIYDLSRQRERGEPASLLSSLTCWRGNADSIEFFAVILAIATIFWERVSAILFALLWTTDVASLDDLPRQVLSGVNVEFAAPWVAAGFAFALAVFSISVVSIPTMLDRGDDAATAIATSVRCVARNPLAMLLWAACIAAIVGASLLLAYVPLVVTAPLVGHATWHAYRELVADDAEDFAPAPRAARREASPGSAGTP